MATSPVPALLVVRPAFSVTVPPWMAIGPLTLVALATVMSAPLPALPRVRPLRLPETGALKPRALVKLAATGSTVRRPVPLKPLVATVGALWRSTRLPPLMAVAPV